MFSLLFHLATLLQWSWWSEAVGPNVAALLPCGILTFIWSRTRFWPMDFIHRKLDLLISTHIQHAARTKKVEQRLARIEASHTEIHRKLDGLAK